MFARTLSLFVLSLFVYLGATVSGVTLLSQKAEAATTNVIVRGTDAIFLAGRSDLTPAPANGNRTQFDLLRHSSITPENLLETHPLGISVFPEAIVTLQEPATGGVSYFNGFGGLTYGPEGNGLSGSNLSSLDGISGYMGPQGPLVGVFLDDLIPSSGPAQATLDFTPSGLGTDFMSLSPDLGQVFFIGDGRTSGGATQSFIAPAEATRLFVGIPDGFAFVGVPGGYEDNDGFYNAAIAVVPEADTWAMMVIGIGVVGLIAHRRIKNSSEKGNEA